MSKLTAKKVTTDAKGGLAGKAFDADRIYGVSHDELVRLIALRHTDPHSILGAHPTDRGVIVRAFRPDAVSVVIITDDGDRYPMVARGDSLFDLLRADRREVFTHRLEIQPAAGEPFILREPYGFLPTISEFDLHLWSEGSYERAWESMGAHACTINGVAGVAFAVWAPAAAGVSVIGDFNGWDGRLDLMRELGNSGVWEIFIPDFPVGGLYKFEVRTHAGAILLKTDPFATATQTPPLTASVVNRPSTPFTDDGWLAIRAHRDALASPMSIYEVHLGSWRRVPEEDNRPLTYRELAAELGDYVSAMGFTHVELMPVMEHPFGGSWGYQVTGYFAPTARYGTPDDFRYLVNELHRRGIGVILDWVPAHFPTDDWSLGRFDGTALYEHLDPRLGHHPEWNTYVFNFGRNEVRSFLLSSANYWLSEFHVDGLRVDAVSSMLYLDYARSAGEWLPNAYGGRENLAAVSFLRMLNERLYARHPGIVMIAEESTAWPAVSRPLYVGGLGFGFKWDMGWMHDTLEYFSKDPIYRRFHHRELTFGLLYSWSENFVLPLSHDEVVYGKRSLLAKMPGSRWERFANLRALFGYLWARSGKKVLFMGGELGQWNEWNHDASLDWHLLDGDGTEHHGVQNLVRDLNRLYRAEPALYEADCMPAGFQWIDANNSDENVIAFVRIAPSSGRKVICVCNFSPMVRAGYRVGVPSAGYYREILNTDSEVYGGGNRGNAGGLSADALPWHGLPYSLTLVLPPLAVLWFEAPTN
ncbi:MAG TPA: 1,4-alpha-glucan branching protein GlgB [Candidatus Binataceae bacterium]|nr:1,4-alpha-glucan branching protein GlgB [Candidatus Binataceae bacterium]